MLRNLDYQRAHQGGSTVIRVAVVVFWIAMMTLLVHREFKQAALGPFASQITSTDLSADDAWYGIYFVRGEGEEQELVKIGYSHQTRRDANPGYILCEESRLRLTVQGETKTVRTRLVAAVDARYRLISLDYELSSDLMKFRLAGEVRGDELHVDIITAGNTRSEVIPVQGTPYVPINLTRRMVEEGLQVGRSYQIPYFDPGSMAMDSLDARIVRREQMQLGDRVVDVFHVRMEFKGLPLEIWIDEEGNVLRERAANMMSMRESKEYALARGWGDDVPMDIIDMAAVRVEQSITRPRRTSSLTVRLSGADLSDLPLEDNRQRRREDGALSIRLEDLASVESYALPCGDEGFAEFLRATATLQSDDPEIIGRARAIVGDQTDALAAARLLSDWVYENLEKQPIVSIPSAADVLQIRRGDCNEHAALLTALARAVGLPAKTLVGVVYNDGSFYYHAWNALWAGEWIAVDATFGQFPADATHIKFLEGDLDQQIPVARLIGRLEIEVVEYQ